MWFKEFPGEKKPIFFPCGAFLSCVADEMFIDVPWFRENSPALKNSWLRACIYLSIYLSICLSIFLIYIGYKAYRVFQKLSKNRWKNFFNFKKINTLTIFSKNKQFMKINTRKYLNEDELVILNAWFYDFRPNIDEKVKTPGPSDPTFPVCPFICSFILVIFSSHEGILIFIGSFSSN